MKKISCFNLGRRHSKQAKALLEHSPSYISVLPTEILAYIFEIGRPLSHKWPWGAYDSTYPFIIASVCRLWRNIALRLTPLIWNSPAISTRRNLKIPLLHIERSGELPLNLFFWAVIRIQGYPTSSREVKKMRKNLLKMVTLLHGQLYRLKDLRVNGQLELHEFSIFVDSLRDARAPKLRTLSISCSTDRRWSILRPIFVDNGAPNLSSLTLHSISNLLLQPSLSSITKLELHNCGLPMSDVDFISFLKSFRSLQQLKLISSGPNAFGILADQIIFPDLLALEFGTLFDALRLSSLQTPSLCTLKIPASDSYMYDTPVASLVSSTLTKFPVNTLIISGPFFLVDQVQIVVPAFLNVKHLVLHRTGINVIVELLRSMSRESHRWESIETLSICPWISTSEAYGKSIENFVNEEQAAPWKPLKEIRLGISTRSSIPVKLQDSFKALAMHVEILPLSFDLTDISNFVGKSECAFPL